jgi:hypothetical protein
MSTLREAMYAWEGGPETERQIGRGLRAFVVERESPALHCRRTAVVFGTCQSDAARRAASPTRLGRELDGDITRASEIALGWDEEFVWPTTTGAQA